MDSGSCASKCYRNRSRHMLLSLLSAIRVRGRERSTAGRFHTEQNCFSLCVSVGYLYWATRVSRDNRQTRDITGEAEILTSGATQLSVEVVSLVAQMIGHREVQESKESSPGIQCSSFLHAKYMEVLIWPPNLPLPGMRS